MHPTVHGWRPASRLHINVGVVPLSHQPLARHLRRHRSCLRKTGSTSTFTNYSIAATKASQLRRIPYRFTSIGIPRAVRFHASLQDAIFLFRFAGSRHDEGHSCSGRAGTATAADSRWETERRRGGAGRGRGDYAVKFRGFSRFTRPHLFSFLGMVRTLNVAPRNVICIHFPTTLLSR